MQNEENKTGVLSERFSLDSLIMGIIGDLDALRNGQISVKDAAVRAELAKQAMNGVRLVVNAQKFLEGQAITLPPSGGTARSA